MSNIKNYVAFASTMLLISTLVMTNTLQTKAAYAQNINPDQTNKGNTKTVSIIKSW